MIMMRVSCTLLTFCLSRLKLRPGLLSPFAHALTQTVCKVYHAYYNHLYHVSINLSIFNYVSMEP